MTILERNLFACVTTNSVSKQRSEAWETGNDDSQRQEETVMKAFMKTFMVALLIGALASVSAFGKGKIKTEKVTFDSDVTVNGTLLKAGDYQLKFNEETNELSILKDGKVKVKTTAHFAPRTDKARSTAVRTLENGAVTELVGFTFGGSSQDLLVGTSGGAVTGN